MYYGAALRCTLQRENLFQQILALLGGSANLLTDQGKYFETLIEKEPVLGLGRWLSW